MTRRRPTRWLRLTPYVLMLAGVMAQAETRLEIETKTIKGQRELPAVTFDIPWQNGEPPAHKEPLVEPLPPMTPLDPDQFRRWLELSNPTKR